MLELVHVIVNAILVLELAVLIALAWQAPQRQIVTLPAWPPPPPNRPHAPNPWHSLHCGHTHHDVHTDANGLTACPTCCSV